MVLEDFYNWLHEHVWMCTYIIAGLAILTFILNFIIRRNKNKGTTHVDNKNEVMKIDHIKDSTVSQCGGDMVINNNYNDSRQQTRDK